VIYYSKSGNTKRIAETIADYLHVEAVPICISKKGRKTKEKRLEDQRLMEAALMKAKAVDLVLLGTPTEFRKPHPVVMRFAERLETNRVAIFCTYYGMPGATIIDLRAKMAHKGIPVLAALDLRLGKEKYLFHQNVSKYVDVITNEHLDAARSFAEMITKNKTTLEPRMMGVCGIDCRACDHYKEGKCNGAESGCQSEANCRAFECCILKKSLTRCLECNQYSTCQLRASSIDQLTNRWS